MATEPLATVCVSVVIPSPLPFKGGGGCRSGEPRIMGVTANPKWRYLRFQYNYGYITI